MDAHWHRQAKVRPAFRTMLQTQKVINAHKHEAHVDEAAFQKSNNK
jgi:hypothetical protein